LLRFQSQTQISALPDEMIDSTWEVIMPTIDITNPESTDNSGILSRLKSSLTTYTPIVEEITFGTTNFKTNTRRVRTNWCNVAEDIENYHEANITMFCSAGMLAQYYLSAWKQLVYNSEGEYYNPMSMYKKNIEVFFYGPGNIGIGAAAAAHFTLQGCFPSMQDRFRLSYKDNPQRLMLTQTFKVDKVVYDASYAMQSIAAELITSPTSIVDKAMTVLGGSSSEYNVEDVYGYKKDLTDSISDLF